MSSASTDAGRRPETRRIARLLGAAAAVAGVEALSPGALAQGCASCRVAAESSGNGSAINLAILILLFPTLAIFAGIVYRAYRHR